MVNEQEAKKETKTGIERELCRPLKPVENMVFEETWNGAYAYFTPGEDYIPKFPDIISETPLKVNTKNPFDFSKKKRSYHKRHWTQRPENKEKMLNNVAHARSNGKIGKKGFKYLKGTHWTQKPENRQRVLNRVQVMVLAKALRKK